MTHLNKKDLSDFVTYRYSPLTLRELGSSLAIMLLIDLLLTVFSEFADLPGHGNTIWLWVHLLVFALMLPLQKRPEGRYLHDGLFSLLLALNLDRMGFAVWSVSYGANSGLRIAMLGTLFFSAVLSLVLVLARIRKGRYGEENNTVKHGYAFAGAIAGFLMMAILKNAGVAVSPWLIVVGLHLAAMLCVMGTAAFLRLGCYLIMKKNMPFSL